MRGMLTSGVFSRTPKRRRAGKTGPSGIDVWRRPGGGPQGSGRPASHLSNALDKPNTRLATTRPTALSNALDKAVGRVVASLVFGLSNALDKWEAGRPEPWGPPPGRRQTSIPEGPVFPALRRFGVRENTPEVSMPRI